MTTMKDDNKKMIRFIDSSYNHLFTVPDGGNIVLTFADGEKAVRSCTFIDPYHVQIGKEPGWGEMLHICQFAEIMERNGTAYAPETPPELPKRCFASAQAPYHLLCRKRQSSFIPLRFLPLHDPLPLGSCRVQSPELTTILAANAKPNAVGLHWRRRGNEKERMPAVRQAKRNVVCPDVEPER